jgi:hypothetical protein
MEASHGGTEKKRGGRRSGRGFGDTNRQGTCKGKGGGEGAEVQTRGPGIGQRTKEETALGSRLRGMTAAFPSPYHASKHARAS